MTLRGQHDPLESSIKHPWKMDPISFQGQNDLQDSD